MGNGKHIYYFIDADICSGKANVVHVMKMCQAFRNNDIAVTLFCNGSNADIDTDALFAKYDISNKFRVKITTIPKFLEKHGHRFGPYYSAWKKSRLIEGNAVVYSRSAMSLFFLKDNIPFVYEAHVEPDVLNRVIEKKILKNKNLKGVVVITAALKQKYLEIFPFLDESQITVLHDAADAVVTNCKTKAKLNGVPDKINIGYVGSLFPGKCMETLIPLAKRTPQYNFHVVGGNEYWVNYWKSKVETEKLENIIFYGFVDNAKVGNYYRAFDVAILPSSKDVYISKNKRVNIGKWTSPLKLFEAMSYGKPMVVSGLETIKEVVDDFEDCVIVEPDDIDQWVEKLNIVCSDDELRNRIGFAAKEKLEKKYTWNKRAEIALNLFK